ncbi:hypothetical protein D1872_155700 [compost metagenome]
MTSAAIIFFAALFTYLFIVSEDVVIRKNKRIYIKREGFCPDGSYRQQTDHKDRTREGRFRNEPGASSY